MRRIALVVSIDTEEDQWETARDGLTVDNLRSLPTARKLMAKLGLRPTWFVSWTAATDGWGAGLVRDLHADPDSEVGGHLHPWNTPPLKEELGGQNTMLNNLPYPLQRAKLRRLTDVLTELRGSPPTSFRAGRWGLGETTAQALIDQGYRVDSSVMPHVSWERECSGPSYLGAPNRMYRMGPATGVITPSPSGPLFEVPVSVGFTAPGPQAVWGRLQRALWRRSQARAALAPLAWRSRLLRKIVLSPEAQDVGAMLTAARRLINDGVDHLHLFWHSQSHTPGLNPFVSSSAERDAFHDRIERLVDGLRDLADFQPMTVSEAAGVV